MINKNDAGPVTKKMNGMDATFLAVGNIIGAGIFSMTGVAIAYAGRGIPITFLLCGVCALLQAIPIMYLSSALPISGGNYMYVCRFTKPILGFLYNWNEVFEVLYLSIYGIGIAQYLPAIFPSINPTITAVVITLIITGICLLNIKQSAVFQNIMVGLILLALGLFVAFGLPRCSDFSFKGMVSETGWVPIIFAISYLRTSLFGATSLANVAGEVKNPRKTIPLAIAASIGLCCILYAFVGLVASHAIPWKEMANQPLSCAAKTFMPKSVLAFFVVGGAVFGLASTMLASFIGPSRTIRAASMDGILPSWLKPLNKNKVPYRIIICMGVVAIIPVVLKLNLDYVFAVITAPGLLFGLLPMLTCLIAPNVLPEAFKKSYFRLPKVVVWIVTLLHVGITLYLSYSLFTTLDLPTIIGIVIFYGGGAVYFVLRCRYMKKKKSIDIIERMESYPDEWVTGTDTGKTTGRPSVALND